MVTAPVNIRFPPGSITDVSFVVQWDAVINQSVDRYIVSVYWTDRNNPIQSVTIDETSYTVTGLTPNTTYTVTVASVDESDCTGVASAGKKVNTTVSISLVATSTIHNTNPTASVHKEVSTLSVNITSTTTDISRSPSINPTATPESDNNNDTKLVPTLNVTVMSHVSLVPIVIATNPMGTTGMYVTVSVIMLLIHS